MPILSVFNTDLGEIKYTSFSHNAVEIGEVFENRCNESYAVLNGATEIFPYFLDVSADLAKLRHRKRPENLVNICEFSLLI
jgi:hypothetical protein